MAESSISIDQASIDWFKKKFGKGVFQQVMARGMERGMLRLWSMVPEYPPAPELSSYKRTGTLGKSINVRTDVRGMSVRGVIGTNVTVKTDSSGYAQYVIGREDQAWMHVGRWWTLEGVVDANMHIVEQQIAFSFDQWFTSEE